MYVIWARAIVVKATSLFSVFNPSKESLNIFENKVFIEASDTLKKIQSTYISFNLCHM